MAKRARNHQRTKTINTRWSPHEYKLLVSRRIESGAKTDSAYLRAAALFGEIRDWSEERARWNALINLARVLETLPPTKLVNETLTETKATLKRMCRP